jgi:hypothetical protein
MYDLLGDLLGAKNAGVTGGWNFQGQVERNRKIPSEFLAHAVSSNLEVVSSAPAES